MMSRIDGRWLDVQQLDNRRRWSSMKNGQRLDTVKHSIGCYAGKGWQWWCYFVQNTIPHFDGVVDLQTQIGTSLSNSIFSHQIPSSWCVSVFGFGLSVWNWTLDFGRWDFQLAISMLDIRALGVFRKKRGGCEVDELKIY